MEDNLNNRTRIDEALRLARDAGFTTLRQSRRLARPRQRMRSPSETCRAHFGLLRSRTHATRARRFFAHGSDRPEVLQVAPGQYDEDMFAALDESIARASEAGLRTILTFTNMWKPVDGKKQYVAWANAGKCEVKDCFFFFNPQLDPGSPVYDPTSSATKTSFNDEEEDQCFKASPGSTPVGISGDESKRPSTSCGAQPAHK